jgi:hypothetical protein
MADEPIKAQCCYCKQIYREGRTISGRVTHGICPACYKREIEKLDKGANHGN